MQNALNRANYLNLKLSHLYPHQVKAIESLLELKSEQARLTLATGAGKTMLQVALAHVVNEQALGKPIVIVAANKKLKQQFA